MTECQRLFLVQARSNLKVFNLLRDAEGLPACHAIHYLQMATEMLGKAYFWKDGPRPNTHRAIVAFLRSLFANRRAQSRLGFEGRNANWQRFVVAAAALAEEIENLAPALTPDGPNPEYPWPMQQPTTAPAEHDFAIWRTLNTASGRKFLYFVGNLFEIAEQLL